MGVYYSGIENKLASGDYRSATNDIENNNNIYNENNVFLFHLDKGVTFHYGAEYDSSINYFIKAENLIEVVENITIIVEKALENRLMKEKE